MTLREKQSEFVRCVAKLIVRAHELGFELSFGEAWRSPAAAREMARTGKGITNSLHIQRLAIDLNLFRGGAFLLDSADHAPLGAYWKTLHPLARWGGDFSRPDGNHYSFEHGGVK